MMTEAVEDLTATLNEAASAAGVVGGMVDSITQAINQVGVLGSLWMEVPVDGGACGPVSLSPQSFPFRHSPPSAR